MSLIDDLNKINKKYGKVLIKKPESHKLKCKRLAEALSKEKRQQFLDYIWEKHLTLGEARKKVNITLEEAMGIMNQQFRTYTYFDKEVK